MGRCHTLAGVVEPTPLGCATRGCFLRAFVLRRLFILIPLGSATGMSTKEGFGKPLVSQDTLVRSS